MEVVMARHPSALSQWIAQVSTQLGHLSKTEALVLALYSFGMVVVGQCGTTSIACFLAMVLNQKEDTLRQRLRESLYDAQDKRGAKRHELDVTRCFAPLLSWVLRWWANEEKRLALALDATTLGQRFTVLAISVLYRGCAIPVAWVVLPATQKGAWMPHWKRLLRMLRGVVPADWTVIVLADRGLYSKTLYRAIQRNAWHPLLRINAQGKFRLVGEDRFRPLSSLVPGPRTVWRGEVDCFVTAAARLRGTLLARWDEGFDTPWLLVTDLAPNQADSVWYGLRAWIEQGFKDGKRGGFRWEQTKMTDPARATRLWLVMALATLWTLSVGGETEARLTASGLSSPLPPPDMSPRPRRLSCFKRGWLTILAALLRHLPIPLGRFRPAPWPVSRFSPVVLDLLCQGAHCVYY
jgi:hypothetical protein